MRAAIIWFAIPLLAGSLPAVAQPAPVIDNERVTVWDITLAKGEAGPANIRTLSAGGNASTATRQFGDVVFVPKGSDATDTLVSDAPAHEIVIAPERSPGAHHAEYHRAACRFSTSRIGKSPGQ
jgi:hypothetical protein